MKKSRSKKIFLIILALVIIVATSFLSGVLYMTYHNGQDVAVSEESTHIKIVASAYPVYIACLNQCQGIEGITVENLTANTGGCPHDYQLTTDDMKKLADADLLIISGRGLEPFMDRIRASYPKLKVVDASLGVDIIEDNAHYWLSLQAQREACGNMSQGIIKAYETCYNNGDISDETYRDGLDKLKYNYREYDNKLMKLAKQYDKQNSSKKPAVFLSDALLYLACDTSLYEDGLLDLEDDAKASPSEVSDICKHMKECDIRYIVATRESETTARTIAASTGAKIIYLDTFIHGDSDLDSYIDAMESNYKNINKALQE